jgi:hypothetical protein
MAILQLHFQSCIRASSYPCPPMVEGRLQFYSDRSTTAPTSRGGGRRGGQQGSPCAARNLQGR